MEVLCVNKNTVSERHGQEIARKHVDPNDPGKKNCHPSTTTCDFLRCRQSRRGSAVVVVNSLDLTLNASASFNPQRRGTSISSSTLSGIGAALLAS